MVMEQNTPSRQLIAEGICRTFRDDTGSRVNALDNFCLHIKKSEIVSLVGPSGCGKSTFLRIAAGLDAPDRGSVICNGQPVNGPHYDRGFVFQEATLFPWMTVYENIAFGLRARKVYDTEKEQVQEYIDLMGLSGFECAYPYQISGGMASRTSLARAFVQKPGLLLLDEPLSALDAFTRMAIQDEILKLHERIRPIILLVTHDIEEAVYMSDRVVVLTPRPGRVAGKVVIDLPHPRERTCDAFIQKRREVLDILEF